MLVQSRVFGARRRPVRRVCGRLVFVGGGVDRVCFMPERYVLWAGNVVVPGVPGERGVGGRQRVAGVLLLQERVRARGGRLHVPDLRSGHVQQPARADGVLELLGWVVLCAFWGDWQRDVSRMPARPVVAGGQPEL